MHTHTCIDPTTGRTLELSGLKTNNACIICTGCCNMQCNCTEGLRFSAQPAHRLESSSCITSLNSYCESLKQVVACSWFACSLHEVLAQIFDIHVVEGSRAQYPQWQSA